MSYKKDTRGLVEELAERIGMKVKVDKFILLPDFVRLEIKDIEQMPATREQFFALLDYLGLEFDTIPEKLKVVKKGKSKSKKQLEKEFNVKLQ